MYGSLAAPLDESRADNQKKLKRIASAARLEYVLLVVLSAAIIYATQMHPTKGS